MKVDVDKAFEQLQIESNSGEKADKTDPMAPAAASGSAAEPAASGAPPAGGAAKEEEEDPMKGLLESMEKDKKP